MQGPYSQRKFTLGVGIRRKRVRANSVRLAVWRHIERGHEIAEKHDRRGAGRCFKTFKMLVVTQRILESILREQTGTLKFGLMDNPEIGVPAIHAYTVNQRTYSRGGPFQVMAKTCAVKYQETADLGHLVT